MGLSSVGADVVLLRRADNGKYDIQWSSDGNVLFGDDQSHAVMSRIYERKGGPYQYWADSTGTRGSFLWTLKEIKKSTPSAAQAYIEDALEPLITAGRISKPANAPFVTVTKDTFNINRLNYTINYVGPTGFPQVTRGSISY